MSPPPMSRTDRRRAKKRAPPQDRKSGPPAARTGSPPPLPRPRRELPLERQLETRILTELRHHDPVHRADAAWQAGERQLRRAYKLLRRLLKDRDPRVRRSAAYGLGRLGNPAAVLLLYDRFIREKHTGVTAQLAIALGRLHYVTARPVLTGLCLRRDPVLRRAGIVALGFLGDPRDMGPLKRFARSRDDTVRQAAAEALGVLGHPMAAKPLRRLLRDRVPAVQRAAVSSLARLQAREATRDLIGLLDRAALPVRVAAVRALVSLRAVAATRALTSLVAHPSDLLAAESSLALARLGGRPPRQRLLTLIQSSNNAVRMPAVRAAGLAGVRQAIQRLSRLLDHPHQTLRRHAVRALGRLAAHQVVPTLLKRLVTEQGVLRAEILSALGRLRAIDALPAIGALLTDSDPRVRAAAVTALGEIALLDHRPVRGLVIQAAALLQRARHVIVIQAAAQAFSRLRHRGPRRAFIRLLRHTLHPHPRVRKSAVRALGLLGDRLAGPAVSRLLKDPDPDVRAAAAVSAGHLGLRKNELRIRTLRAAAMGPAEALRRALFSVALALLRSTASAADLRPIQTVLMTPGRNREQDAALAAVLSEIPRPWAIRLLQQARQSPSYLVRSEALRGLSIWPPAVRVRKAAPTGSRATPRTRAQATRPRKVAGVAGPFQVSKPGARGPTGGGCGCGAAPGPTSGQTRSPWFWLLLGVILSRLIIYQRN